MKRYKTECHAKGSKKRLRRKAFRCRRNVRKRIKKMKVETFQRQK
jgi:hypothetical protein